MPGVGEYLRLGGVVQVVDHDLSLDGLAPLCVRDLCLFEKQGFSLYVVLKEHFREVLLVAEFLQALHGFFTPDHSALLRELFA